MFQSTSRKTYQYFFAMNCAVRRILQNYSSSHKDNSYGRKTMNLRTGPKLAGLLHHHSNTVPQINDINGNELKSPIQNPASQLEQSSALSLPSPSLPPPPPKKKMLLVQRGSNARPPHDSPSKNPKGQNSHPSSGDKRLVTGEIVCGVFDMRR